MPWINSTTAPGCPVAATTDGNRRRWTLQLCLMVCTTALVAVLAGCASYTDQIRESHRAVSNSQAELAVDKLNKQLGVEGIDEQPRALDDENALLLLERATLLQALGHYESASRDMMAVDDRLEWLDIQSDVADTILQYVYSDDAGPYRAPAHERLLLNTMNMINFLAAGDHSGARVEARRFDVLQRFFLDDGSAQLIPDILGLGNYLAATAFEASQNYQTAARFYTKAYLHGTWPEPDDGRLLDIITVSGYRGAGLGEMRPDADDILERAGQRERISRSEYRERYQTGDTLMVVQTGMVPYRRAERVSLQQALRYSNRSPYVGLHFTAHTSDEALALYSAGLVTWLNTTSLTRQGTPSRNSAMLSLNNRTYRLTSPIAVGDQVEAAWNMVSATALAAGISRAIVRAAAGKATQHIVEAVAEQAAVPGAGLIGWLSGMALQASLAATDTPDTRSWTTLPDGVHLVRLQLEPGVHDLELEVAHHRDSRQIEVNPDRFHLVNFSRIR